MKYNKIFITSLAILMIGGIYAQDNIINEIAKGGKFIVRDEEQNEAMVIEEGNVGVMGTLKLGVLPKGEIGNTIVVWDPVDKLLKLQAQNLSAGSSDNFKSEGLNKNSYNNISDDIVETNTKNKTVYLWTKFKNNNIFRLEGNVGIGTNNPGAKLEVSGQVKITGGTPEAGKVLTSDNTGLATWQKPEVNFWAETGENVYRSNGNVGIGTDTPAGVLDLNSTSGALIVPRMTTAQRDNVPVINGSIIYNTSSNEFNFLQDGSWVHF